MKLLLDENVPAPVTSTVKTLLRRSHDVQHVIDMPGWSGTKDLHLYGKAKDAGFEVVVTNDAKQMNRKLEVEAIAKSGLHRIQYPHKQDGLAGARAGHSHSLCGASVSAAGTDGRRRAAPGDVERRRSRARSSVRGPQPGNRSAKVLALRACLGEPAAFSACQSECSCC